MRELWDEIWQTIRRNKWRSLMTAFGVFWGLLMLILLVGLGRGVFNGIMTSLKSVPSNSMFFGGSTTSIPYKGFGRDRYVPLENEDVDLLRASLGEKLRYVTPLNQTGTMKANVGEYYYDASVIGTEASYYNVMPQQLIYGRYINQIDQLERRKVCVLGQTAYEALFPDGGDHCGERIQVGSISYIVVGVVKKLSNQINFGSDLNKTLILPISTAQLAYNQGHNIYMCIVTLQDQYPMKEWQDKILAIPKLRHVVHPDDKQAFWSFNLSEILGVFNALFLGINILLWIVGCGSLLAGLIGISNIMLVTVRERTQEIGIRRALGAKPFTILSQILAESLVLTLMAGLSGLMVGVWILRGVSWVVAQNPASSGDSFFSMKDPQIGFDVAVAATLVIVLGGLLAGWMPARRAMKIKAIEALREE